MNGISCGNLFTAATTARVHSDKYEKDNNAVVTFLTQYIERRGPSPSVKLTYVAQARPAKWQKTSTSPGTFSGNIELKKYSREEFDSMLVAFQ